MEDAKMLWFTKCALSSLSVVCAMVMGAAGAHGAPAANGEEGLQEALRKAGEENKQVLMKVGANW